MVAKLLIAIVILSSPCVLTAQATSEEAVDVFDRIARAEGTGFLVTKVSGVLPPDTLTRADFARAREWCSTPRDNDDECDTQFKDALFLYGQAIPIAGGFLCEGARQECMEAGKNTGYFPGNIVIELDKADALALAKHSEVDDNLEDHARKLRGKRHHKSKERTRQGGKR